MASIPDWLVGIGAIVAAGASVWTVFQQRTINRHDREIKQLDETGTLDPPKKEGQ